MNDYRINREQPRILTESEKKSIERRQQIALMYRAKEKIEDYQDDVFNIIENDGLKSEDANVRLKTSKDVLEFIIPKKKSLETTITHRRIEDLIKEDTEEAQIIDDNSDGQP